MEYNFTIDNTNNITLSFNDLNDYINMDISYSNNREKLRNFLNNTFIFILNDINPSYYLLKDTNTTNVNSIDNYLKDITNYHQYKPNDIKEKIKNISVYYKIFCDSKEINLWKILQNISEDNAYKREVFIPYTDIIKNEIVLKFGDYNIFTGFTNSKFLSEYVHEKYLQPINDCINYMCEYNNEYYEYIYIIGLLI